jgi:hypothetical protein
VVVPNEPVKRPFGLLLRVGEISLSLGQIANDFFQFIEFFFCYGLGYLFMGLPS